jgi:hypothetical protein
MINFRHIYMLIADFMTSARKLGFSQVTVLQILNACLGGKRILGMGILRPHILGIERSHPLRAPMNDRVGLCGQSGALYHGA